MRRALVPLLSGALLAPGGAALAEPAAPVEVTAAVRTAEGRLVFVTERATTRTRGLELAQRMRARRHVVAASVATPVRALADDPLRARQWGLTQLAAEQTWAQGPADGTLVAVIDTGVDATHPELAGVTVPGLDLVGTGDGRTDPHGHGTHVAGVVAAPAGNGTGGAGLAQGARILPVRALAADGSGYDSAVAKGVSWATDNGARVINLSLGGDRQSSLLTAAIDYARSKGVVVVAAAGNAGAAGDPVLYPAATRGVVAVGAVGVNGARPGWSSSGDHLAVAAPGVGILSTAPGGYATWDGTSMAAPFVAAAAALLLTDEPALTPDEVRARLMATARDLGTPGVDRDTGAGMVDVVAARALSRPAPPVVPVTSPPATTEPAEEPVTGPAPSSEPSPAVPAPVVSDPVAGAPVAEAPVAGAPPAASAPGASAPVVEAQPGTTAPVTGPQPGAAAPVTAPVPAPVPAPGVSAPVPQVPAPPTPTAVPVAAPRTEPAPVLAPTVSVFPASIAAGKRVTVTYRGAPGAVVDVLSRTQPALAFSRIGSVVLDDSGTATSTHAPQKNTRIAARSADGTVSTSQPVIAVRSVASLNVQRVGTRTHAFTGRVYPALDRRLVSLYRNGVLVAQGRTGASGVYRIVKRLAGGTYGFQVRTPDDQHNLGTVSPLRRALIA